jgi:hypothetical protein
LYELIPILAGVGAGAAALELASPVARAAVIAVVALGAALVAGTVSGELEESAAFLLWDTFQAVAAACLSMVLWRIVRKRRERA